VSGEVMSKMGLLVGIRRGMKGFISLGRGSPLSGSLFSGSRGFADVANPEIALWTGVAFFENGVSGLSL